MNFFCTKISARMFDYIRSILFFRAQGASNTQTRAESNKKEREAESQVELKL